MTSSFTWLLSLLFAIAAVGGPRVSEMTYAFTTHYLDADTSCSGMPYRMELWESIECSEASCAASVNGLFDGVASTVCTEDYQNEVWKRFGSSVYILKVEFHDTTDGVCSIFGYARAYRATGECLVGPNSNHFTAKVETNGSATLHTCWTESCSLDDPFLSTFRATKEVLESNKCDGSYQWFTNQGNTAAPLVTTTTTPSISSSAATEGTDTAGTTSTDTTTTTDSITDTYDAATSPGTSTSSSSSSDGDSSPSVGGIVGIVTGSLVSLALVYVLVFHKDIPINLNCCGNCNA